MSLSEFEIIDHYFKDLTGDHGGVNCGIGDDAALISVAEGFDLAISVDTLVSGVHFLPQTDAFDLGCKSLAVNLSDLAAMAATPRWMTLALTIPENNAAWLEEFSRGLAELAGNFSISLVGGDLTQGPLSITIQIMGTVATGRALTRSGARAGDQIYVSNYLGGAGLALRAMLTGYHDDWEIPDDCRLRLQRPDPRVALGSSLQGLASAAIDISDGLGADLAHILRASSVGAVVDLDQIPVYPALGQIQDRDEYWSTVLSAGDDYELCFTVGADHGPALAGIAAEQGFPLTCIGRIVAGSGLRWLDTDGSEYRPLLTGYRHF